MTVIELKQEKDLIVSYIGDNRMEKAFEHLDDFLIATDSYDLKNKLISLKSQFSQNKDLFLTIGKANEEERNRVVFGLIDILNQASKSSEAEKANLQKEIEAQEQQVRQLVNSQLSDIIIPDNYKVETSNEFKFSFCYPQNWSFHKFTNYNITYGYIIENEPNARFNTNMNVVIGSIAGVDAPLEQIYAANIHDIQQKRPDAVISSEIFLFKGLQANRSKIDYVTQGVPVTLFQVSVADAKRERLFHISFTCLAEKYEANRLLFENIISTLRF